jgi:hypothetical protein
MDAHGMMSDRVGDEDEMARQFMQRRRELAARYRLQRVAIAPELPPAYHAAASQALADARVLMASQQVGAASEILEDAIADYPYSNDAAALTHELIRCYAASGALHDTRINLVDLWERHPDYPHFATVLRECIEVAEYIQLRNEPFDLNADLPINVIKRNAIGDLTNANHLFYFLVAHGDLHNVAPRAQLAIARSTLLRANTNEDQLARARLLYDQFLDRYPDNDLVFEALIEQAVGYLLGYRGDHFDMGMLIKAHAVVEQAAVYAGDDTNRRDLISRYRALIRRWQQDRDLQVARWYRDRGHRDQALFYYKETVDRDATSNTAQTAHRERSKLQ